MEFLSIQACVMEGRFLKAPGFMSFILQVLKWKDSKVGALKKFSEMINRLQHVIKNFKY